MAPTINLAEDLYRDLGRYGNRDESWNDVVARVLEYVDEDNALEDKENRATSYARVGTAQSSEDSVFQKLEDGTVVRHRYQRGGYGGTEVEATVVDGKVEYDGTKYNSPSPAALAADEDIRGADSASALNGWDWWEYENKDRDWVPIDTLREK